MAGYYIQIRKISNSVFMWHFHFKFNSIEMHSSTFARSRRIAHIHTRYFPSLFSVIHFYPKLTHHTVQYVRAIHFAVSSSVSHLPARPYGYDGGRCRRRRWQQFNWGMILRVCFCNVQLTPPPHTHLPCLCGTAVSSFECTLDTQYKALECKVLMLTQRKENMQNGGLSCSHEVE